MDGLSDFFGSEEEGTDSACLPPEACIIGMILSFVHSWSIVRWHAGICLLVPPNYILSYSYR